MTDTVQVPRDLLFTALFHVEQARIPKGGRNVTAEKLQALLAAAPQVAAEPAWFVVETPGADFDWSFFKTEAEARDATHRGDGSDPVITPLYTHAEPVAEAQPALVCPLPAGRQCDCLARGKREVRADCPHRQAEAQPAQPTQEQIMRLADEYSFSRARLETCEPYDRRYQRQECDEARAALQAALSALPKEQP